MHPLEVHLHGGDIVDKDLLPLIFPDLLPPAAKDLAIRQIVNRAVASTEIVDILAATGITTPDISILSEEFLAEVQQMERKNRKRDGVTLCGEA